MTRSRVVPIRFTPGEYRRVERIAGRHNMSVSALTRLAMKIYVALQRKEKRDLLAGLVARGDLSEMDFFQ